jgi:hypothetical protein
MIDEGTYRARGVEAALGYTANEKEQVAVEIELIDDGEHGGKRLTWYGFFTDKTTETTLKALRTLGWAGDDLSNLAGIDANEVDVVIAHEEDQEGHLRVRVRWINALGSGGLQLKTRMDEGQAAAFAERMKGHVLAAKARTVGSPARAAANGGRPPPTGAAAAKGGAPPDSDDIPFLLNECDAALSGEGIGERWCPASRRIV